MVAAKSGRSLFFLLLGGATLLMALVARPLATPLFLAIVLAAVLWPAYRKIARVLGNRDAPASGVIVLGVVLLLVAPLVAFSTFVVSEASAGFEFVSTTVRSDGVSGLVAKLPDPLEKLANKLIAQIPEEWEFSGLDEAGAAEPGSAEPGAAEAGAAQADAAPKSSDSGGVNAKLVEHASSVGGKAVLAVGAVARATGSLVFQATMMLIALYFLFVHGNELVSWLDDLLPLPHGTTRELLNEFKTVSYAVVVSTVVTSGVQALAALVGYLIASVPHPIFFASLTFFVAFVPAVGAASVCLLAALILFATGHPYMALFLVIWGFAVVGLVDNLVKPILIRSGMKMSGAIVFFALIGGLGAFGAAGLLIGPLVVALFLALLRIYQRDFKAPAKS